MRRPAIKRVARSFTGAMSGVALAVTVLSPAAAAERGAGWLLVTPPPVPEKRTLMKLYAADSEAEVKAAVASLPGDEQVRLVTKVYEILTIPTITARTEALLDVLQDQSAPVSRWRRIERFESATSCEQERQRALHTFERAAAKIRASSADGDELAVEEWTVFEGLTACRLSRCVPESTLLSR